MLRILLAEDEALLAMELEFAIGDLGHEVVGTASTLDEALEMAETLSFDGAILDVCLGAQEVFPAARRIRETGAALVFCSGHAFRSEIAQLFPGVPLVEKPARPSELLEKLIAQLG